MVHQFILSKTALQGNGGKCQGWYILGELDGDWREFQIVEAATPNAVQTNGQES